MAFDLEVEKTFKKFHVKQLKKNADTDSPKFFFYADGHYQFLTDTEIIIWSDEIARRITPQDDRTMLSKIRKQASEDLRIKINEAEYVDFNKDSVEYINFNNGAYHLKTSLLMPHSPDHYLTYKLPIKYTPGATCPNFERALKMSFNSQADQNEMLKGLYYLISVGSEVRTNCSGFMVVEMTVMHNKYWIFDGQTVWTGSTNITESGIFKQDNNTLVIHSPALAAIYEAEFNEMWNGEFGPRSPSQLAQQSTVVNGTPIQVIFTSEDPAIEKAASPW